MKKLLCYSLFVLIGIFAVNSCDTSSAPTKYKVTISAEPAEGGTVSPSSGKYKAGTTLNIMATPSNDWKFVKWEGDYSGTSASATITVDDNMHIIGVFKKKKYDLTVHVDGKGTVQQRVIPTSGVKGYKAGKVVELTAKPAKGWRFVKWKGDISSNDNPAQITIDQPKTVTAVFKKKDYPLTVNTVGKGVVNEKVMSAKTTNYKYGTKVQLTAKPETGWKFVKWKGDLSGSQNPATITVKSKKEVTAVFKKKKSYSLTIQTIGKGSVNEKVVSATFTNPNHGLRVQLIAKNDLSKAQTMGYKAGNKVQLTSYGSSENKTSGYTAGTKIKLTANPHNGWEFVKWKGDLSGSKNPATITMNQAKTVTAVFKKKTKNNLFKLGSNGVTIKCPDADFGDSGTVNGVTYTKRRASRITPKNAATTCTSGITFMDHLFENAKSFNADISSWDVSNVTNMSYMFAGATSFNQPIGHWDVSNVTNMAHMFDMGGCIFCGSSAGAGRNLKNKITRIKKRLARGGTHASTSGSGSAAFNADISGWDVSSVRNMAYMFAGATSFNQPIGSWDVSSVITMKGMFKKATSFNQPIGNWKVRNVTNMALMFAGAKSFNKNINNWDVSSVTNMANMFWRATSFNKPLGKWKVRNVTNMAFMFQGASSFNQNINGWNVSSVTTMAGMFLSYNDLANLPTSPSAFNKPLNSWNVSNVTNMSFMFQGADNFNQSLNNWKVGNVENMRAMFYKATAFNQPLNSWDVSSVTDMRGMFRGAKSFNKPLNKWDVSNVRSMDYMFNNAKSFDQDISSWCVARIPSEPKKFADGSPLTQAHMPVWGTCPSSNPTGNLFYLGSNGVTVKCPGASYGRSGEVNGVTYTKRLPNNITAQNAATTCTSGITDMSYLFAGMTNFNGDISSWDVSNVTNMAHMFDMVSSAQKRGPSVENIRGMKRSAAAFTPATAFNQDISSWDVSNVRNMSFMFRGADAFNQPIGRWDVGNVRNMAYMFRGAKSFNQPIGNWNVSHVQNMQAMFWKAVSFNQSIDQWNVSNVENMLYMFVYAKSFNKPIGSWDVSNVTNMSYMFLPLLLLINPLEIGM